MSKRRSTKSGTSARKLEWPSLYRFTRVAEKRFFLQIVCMPFNPQNFQGGHTWASLSPKSSIFFFRGESSSSSEASWICCWILPISVRMPMSLTTPTQDPLLIAVPAKSIHSFAWSSQSASLTGSEVLETATDSPARHRFIFREVAQPCFWNIGE